jgi:hypothetical protein
MTWNTIISVLPRDRANETKVTGSVPMWAISSPSFCCLRPATLLTLTLTLHIHPGVTEDAEVNQPLPSARSLKVKPQSCDIIPTGAEPIITRLLLLLLLLPHPAGSTQCCSLFRGPLPSECLQMNLNSPEEPSDLNKLFNTSNLPYFPYFQSQYYQGIL